MVPICPVSWYPEAFIYCYAENSTIWSGATPEGELSGPCVVHCWVRLCPSQARDSTWSPEVTNPGSFSRMFNHLLLPVFLTHFPLLTEHNKSIWYCRKCLVAGYHLNQGKFLSHIFLPFRVYDLHIFPVLNLLRLILTLERQVIESISFLRIINYMIVPRSSLSVHGQ